MGCSPWISPRPKSSFSSEISHARSSPTASATSGCSRSSAAANGSTPSCGPSSRARASPRSRFPQRLAGAGRGWVGMQERGAVFEEQGRHTAPVPLLATAVLGALPIAEFGAPEQRERWLRPVAEREAVLSGALLEYASSEPGAPRTRALSSGRVWRLDGEKHCVPAADRASVILVPARTPEGVAVFLVDPQAAGVSLEPQVATHREPQWRMQLSGAPAEGVLGLLGQGEEIVEWIAERAALALAAIQIGVAEEATRRTARYISERKQFGKAIATFQGVALRAADAWIDVEALRGVVMQAAWRVAAGRPPGGAIRTAHVVG